MDAGKINSLIQTLRPDAGGRTGTPQGDAAFAAKIVAATLVDDLLNAGESDPQSSPPPPPPALPVPPRGGVIVNLSTAVVASEMASRVVSALARPAERAHMNAESPAPNMPAQVYSLTERLGEAMRAGAGSASAAGVEDRRGQGTSVFGTTLEDRRTAAPASSGAIPTEARSDVLPYPQQHPVAMNQIAATEQRTGAASVADQARNSEYLAGLHGKGETPALPRWLRLDRLLIGAIVLGLLLVLCL